VIAAPWIGMSLPGAGAIRVNGCELSASASRADAMPSFVSQL